MTNEEILSNVALIKNAVNPGENSAKRVGETLEGIAQLAIDNQEKVDELNEQNNGAHVDFANNIGELNRNINQLSSNFNNHVAQNNNEHSTINGKITTLEGEVNTLESHANSARGTLEAHQESISILNGYFTSNQGENGKPSINRRNLPYYLNEAMVWGGDVNKLKEVTISDALRSKNSISIQDTTTKLTSANYTSFKNVYFTAVEDLLFNGAYLTKGDIIISTGTKWVTLIGTHPRTEITIINAEPVLFEFFKNEDEFVHYIYNNDNLTNIFNVECAIGENNRMTFYVLVTNNSTKDITFNLPYGQVLIIPQGKERYFEARVINDRYVFDILPLSDTESKISTLETKVTTLDNDVDGQRLKINNFEIFDFTGGTIKADFAYKVFNYLDGQINIDDNYKKSWKIEFILSRAANSLPSIQIATECYIMPRNILMLDYSSHEFMGLRPLDDVAVFEKNDIISIERFGTNISITLIRKF